MPTIPLSPHRWLRRIIGLGCALGAALLALGALGALAEAGSPHARPAAPAVLTLTVTTPIDAGDDNPGNTICHNAVNGLCSLRAALQELNAIGGGTINLPAGTYTLTLDGLGDLQIKQDISLLGAGPATTLIEGDPAGWNHRILRVQDGAVAIVSGVTISGGNLLLQNGGGIDVITSTLLLTNSVVVSNSAASGGGIYNSGQLDIENSVIRSNQAITSGGGIYSNANDPAGTGGALTLRQSQVLSNSVQRQQGGGLYYNDLSPALGHVLVAGSTISANLALGVIGFGGGIYQENGSLVVSASVIDANQGTEAGGIYSEGGRLEVADSFIEDNVTADAGGGIQLYQGTLVMRVVTLRHNQAVRGGGVSSSSSQLDVANSGLISNTVSNLGGGWFSLQDTGVFTITLFSQNLAATASGYGGGLYSSDSALTFTSSVFAGNTAHYGGGLDTGGSGLAGQTVLLSSTVSGNHAIIFGGGLYSGSGAPVTLAGTDVTSNTADLGGGGVYNNGGQITLLNSAVRHNVAGTISSSGAGGGGLNNTWVGRVSVLGSTFSDNTSINYLGGGVLNDGAAATVTMVNSTLNGNQTTQGALSAFQPEGTGSNVSGGGLANLNGTVDLSNVTVTSNTVHGPFPGGGLFNSGLATTTTTLRNTIVALNLVTGASGDDCAGTFNAQGYNLVQDLVGCTLTGNTTGDVIGQDPLLLPLGNYGGPTQTRSVPANSPALDAGNPSGCRDSLNNKLKLDQRGQPRSSGPRCDIGAVEGVSTEPWPLFLPSVLR